MFQKVLNPLERCLLKFVNEELGVFSGYAAVFNKADAVGDVILSTAFDQSLAAGYTIKMFFNHAHGEVPVGDWTVIKVDDYGLYVEGKIDMNHRDGPMLYSAMKRGAMDGLSQGFTTKNGDFEKKADGGRVFKNLQLKEISLVSFPCEESARVMAVKMDLTGAEAPKDLEKILRDAGFSKSEATAFVSQAMRIRSDSVETSQPKLDVMLKSALSEFSNRFK